MARETAPVSGPGWFELARDPQRLRRHVTRQRQMWRIWWKYDSRPFIEKFGWASLVFVTLVLIDRFTPVYQYVRMPTEDPNQLMKDPFWVQKRQERLERQADLTRRAAETVVGRPRTE